MSISLQADSTLPQGYILVDGQRAATISTTGLSATLAANTVTTSALVSGAVTTEKIAPGAVITADLADGAVTAAKMSGGQSGSAPVYGCRAWVNFYGTLSAGGVNASQNNQPVFIRSSGNIDRVIKTNTAKYTIFFTTHLPLNYAALAADNASTISNMRFGTNTYTISSIDVEVYTGSTPGLTIDADVVTCAFIG
jgi:hypothetical protein